MQGGPIYAKVQVNDGRYNVTTTGIADGEYATVNWYKDAGKSETTSAPLVSQLEQLAVSLSRTMK